MSHGFDALYNAAKSDDFTFYLNEVLKGSLRDWTVGKLHKHMDFERLRVHSVLKSTFKGRQGEALPLPDFFVASEHPSLAKVRSKDIAAVSDILRG